METGMWIEGETGEKSVSNQADMMITLIMSREVYKFDKLRLAVSEID
jgi:hypothetical protein